MAQIRKGQLLMFKVTYTMSKKLQDLIATRGGFKEKLFRTFGFNLWFEWNKLAGSESFWRYSGTARTVSSFDSGNKSKNRPVVRRVTLSPLPNKLTKRSGVLLSAARGLAGGYQNIRVYDTGVEVTKGTRGVPYAARQEFQKGGARSYIRRSALRIMRNPEIARKVWNKTVLEVVRWWGK